MKICDLQLHTVQGGGTTTVEPYGTDIITVTHGVFAINTVPEVFTHTPGAKVAVKDITRSYFMIEVSNLSSTPLDIGYAYQRVGLI